MRIGELYGIFGVGVGDAWRRRAHGGRNGHESRFVVVGGRVEEDGWMVRKCCYGDARNSCIAVPPSRV